MTFVSEDVYIEYSVGAMTEITFHHTVKNGFQSENAGHIGALLWDEVTAIGCSITDCTATPLKMWLSACK
jgi:hypothetical protein